MTNEYFCFIENKALFGIPLNRDEIIELLSIPLGSDDDKLLREAAFRVAKAKTGGAAYLWCAVGADFAPCPMNCNFCSLGEKWGIVKKEKVLSDDDIINQIANFVKDGARFVVLRTTEFYSLDVLANLVNRIRQTVLGEYEIILNVGEFDLICAEKLFENGVDGIYHACRLREGIDTPFEPDVRNQTMDSVYRSSLKLISLVEPIGTEHTNEEIADNFLNILKYHTEISGAMARVPVAGTPLGNTPTIDSSRLAQIIAVLRLAGGDVVKDICVHPASDEAIQSGANVVVVETGAVPREGKAVSGNWQDFGIVNAKKMLEKAGYKVFSSKKRVWEEL